MKKIIFSLSVFAIVACGKPSTGTFGESFDSKGALPFKVAMDAYQSGKDTVYTIQGKVENVCQGEGCWLTFKNDSTEFLIDTKEKFSMPKDCKGKTAIAKGKFSTGEEGEIEFTPSGVIIQ